MVVHVTDQNFEEVVLKSDKPVLVDFWAEWCGPCRMIGPVVEELANKFGEEAIVAKLNVDENPETAVQFGIRSIPTLLFFKQGKVVDKQVGVAPQTVLESKLKAQLT